MLQPVETEQENHADDKSFLRLMLKKASLLIYAIALAAIIAWEAVQITGYSDSLGKPISIQLSRGAFTVLDFPSKEPQTRAVILFGSGDGGWGGLEEAICFALEQRGYEVIGIDFEAYARTDYDLGILEADIGMIAKRAEAPYGDHPPPLILAGYSMGAAQAIAEAGGPHPPAGLTGVLLIDPCSRGRYGLRFEDQSNVLPTGPGTFSVDEFARTMRGLHVVQWHAAEDTIDSRAWLASLTAPHEEFDFLNTGHYYNNDRADFLGRLVNSVAWLLSPAQNAVTTTGSKS